MSKLVTCQPEEVGLQSDRLDRISGWMRSQIERQRAPGMVTLVSRRGKVAYLHVEGQADLLRHKPMAADTIFRIYSMTKPLTSTAIMMLYEQGRFQLDDPISRFIPAFAGQRVFTGGSRGKIETEPAKRDITFRDLLTPYLGAHLRLHGGDPRRRPLSVEQGRFPDPGYEPQGDSRESGVVAAAGATGNAVELLNRDGRSRLPRRGDLGRAVRAVPGRSG